MRLPATAALALGSISAIDAVSADSGVCGLTVTFQSCHDVSYFFSYGQPWPVNDKELYCRSDSVCGKLVPYIRNTPYFADQCAVFDPYADTITTFRDYCRGQPVAQIAGDMGLLKELKQTNGSVKPTPVPTRGYSNSEPYSDTPGSIVGPDANTGISGALATSTTSLLLAVVNAVTAIAIPT